MISAPVARVEVAGRLVGEQHVGAVGQRPGDRHALLLAAGELRRQVAQAVAEADPLEQLARPGAALGRREARRRERRLHVPSAVSVGMRLNCWKTNPMRSRRSAASSRSPIRLEAAALEAHLAGRRAVQRAEQLQQRRLARAGRAGDDDHLAVVDPQVDAVDGATCVAPLP